MSRDQKFSQQWEFRRRDDDLDSSSTDTKSSSSSQPDFRKQKMTSSLILLKNDEGSDNPLTQQKSQVNHDSGIHFELGKAEKMQVEASAKGNVIKNKKDRVSTGKRKRKNSYSKHDPIGLEGFILHKNDKGNANQLTQQESQVNYDSGFPFELGKAKKQEVQPSAKSSIVKDKMKRAFVGKGKRKKNNCRKHKPVSMDGFKIFMNSILEELKVAREKMLTWMREEMQKLVAIELASRLKKKKGNNMKKIGKVSCKNNVQPGIKAHNHNDEFLEIFVRSDRKTNSSNCHVVLEELANQEQVTGAITSNEKESAKRSRSSAITQVYSPINTSLCLGSSKACVENHKLHSSLNYIQPGPVGSKTSLISKRTSVCIDASDHGGFFSSLQQAEQLGSFSKMGSQDVDHLNQHAQTSTLGMDFQCHCSKGRVTI